MTDLRPCGCAGAACGCCAGVAVLTPLDTVNRPGLGSLNRRIGTHASFLATMRARLSSHVLDGGARPLARLRTRAGDDAAIALLDAWATIGDVLTFYQQRITNEGYLRTATEDRSAHWLGRLIGYSPRPGVAASVYLSFSIDKPALPAPGTPPQSAVTFVPKSARAQTVPGQGELPQSFETADVLQARYAWNRLRVRQSQPQQLQAVLAGRMLYLKGVATRLKPGDPLLIGSGTFGTETASDPAPTPFRVVDLAEDAAADRTRVTLEPWLTIGMIQREAEPLAGTIVREQSPLHLAGLIEGLAVAPSRPLANALQLPRDLKRSFDVKSDATLQVVAAATPRLGATLGAAIGGDRNASAPQSVRVFAPRLQAGLFGSRAPRRSRSVTGKIAAATTTTVEDIGEWPIVYGSDRSEASFSVLSHEAPTQLYLDSAYEGLGSGGWTIVDSSAVPVFAEIEGRPGVMVAPAQPVLVARVAAVQPRISRAVYGLAADTSGLTLAGGGWIKIIDDAKAFESLNNQAVWNRDFQVVRNTVVYAKSEELALADAPLTEDVCSRDGLLELDALYLDLEPGRFVIVSGERADLGEVDGVFASEVAMITEVVHDVAADVVDPATGKTERLPLSRARTDDMDARGKRRVRALAGDRTHSFVASEKPLSYCYRRGSVQIHGNVVKATHGETRRELLGSGDGSRTLQTFALKQSPVTWLAAPTAAGAATTLEVFVDDVRWHAATSFIDAAPTDRLYVERTDAEGIASVMFGNGEEGARLPTGAGNVTAVYRSGIGRAGNAAPGQISQLATRPLGVKDVVNPLRASGGADAERLDQIRRNAPLAVMALDRLVSTRDYVDFARTFAGIDKADAQELSDGQAVVVHVTVAGTDDIPIDSGSDLMINLRRALVDLGDPFQPIRLAARELMLLIVDAKLRIDPDHLWERVVTDVRRALLDHFGFDRRDLGQGAASSEVLAVVMAVPGVVYVDLDAFGAIPTLDFTDSEAGRPRTPDQTAAAVAGVIATGVMPVVNVARARRLVTLRPAQLLILDPAVPATLVLNQIV